MAVNYLAFFFWLVVGLGVLVGGLILFAANNDPPARFGDKIDYYSGCSATSLIWKVENREKQAASVRFEFWYQLGNGSRDWKRVTADVAAGATEEGTIDVELDEAATCWLDGVHADVDP